MYANVVSVLFKFACYCSLSIVHGSISDSCLWLCRELAFLQLRLGAVAVIFCVLRSRVRCGAGSGAESGARFFNQVNKAPFPFEEGRERGT